MPTDFIYFKTIDSTNTWGINHFDEIEDKTVICADNQTKGRGRFNREWISGDFQNNYISFVLKPQKIDYIANLTQYLSTSVSKVIESYGVNPEIKWPNDVLVNGKKICGILCESKLKNNKPKGVVLGIGVNLNTPEKILKGINKLTTSLHIEAGRNIDKQEFLNKLTHEFFLNYENVINKGFGCFKEDYLLRAKFLNKTVYIQQHENSQMEAYTASAIDENGNLIVKTQDDLFKTVYSGDLILKLM